jgi:hypothetical protein
MSSVERVHRQCTNVPIAKHLSNEERVQHKQWEARWTAQVKRFMLFWMSTTETKNYFFLVFEIILNFPFFHKILILKESRADFRRKIIKHTFSLKILFYTHLKLFY